LAEHFILLGHLVKAWATTESRLPELRCIKADPFIIDIGKPSSNFQTFLQADILIVNIPNKNTDNFSDLIQEIGKSEVRKVLFVSSISVYENRNKTISESNGEESKQNPLSAIEAMFRKSNKFQTTIVRFGGLSGYSRNPGKFFRNGRLVRDSDSNVNLIHRDDCIKIISQIVEQNIWDEDFNCCADTHPTKREFYTQATKQIGAPAPDFDESGGMSFKIISNQKVKRILNYSFLHPDLMEIKFE